VDRIPEFTQLLEAGLKEPRGRVSGELGEGGIQGHEELERGLTAAPVIEIEPSPQGELLTCQRLFTAAEQGGEASLGRENAASALPPGPRDDLTRVGPQAVRHLLAATVAQAGDKQLMAAHGMLVGIGGGEAQGMKRPIEHAKAGTQLILAGGRQPGGGLTLIGARDADVDHRGSRGRHRCGTRLRLDLRATSAPGEEGAALWSAEGGDHEDVRRRGLRCRAQVTEEVAAVGQAEAPRELDLTEGEEARSAATARGVYPPGTLIAYLLGAIGTMGSGIWLMWLISWVHWLGWRRSATWAESCLFWPKSGV